MWEIVRKSFDKNEVENLTVLLKLDYLRFFWNYLDMNYVFQSNVTCEFMWFWHYAMCDFPVITRFGFHSLCDNGIKSRSMPFHFGWCLLPYCPWGEEVSWLCVGEATAHGAKRPHAREVLFDALSLLPIGGEKNLEGISQVTVHGAKSLHTREDNIMPVMNGWIPWPVYVIVW